MVFDEIGMFVCVLLSLCINVQVKSKVKMLCIFDVRVLNSVSQTQEGNFPKERNIISNTIKIGSNKYLSKKNIIFVSKMCNFVCGLCRRIN